jgi:MiaB-like tRNA modifying enzyme
MKVFVKSYGCSTNQFDGQVLAGCLADAGYECAADFSAAEVVIYNTCAVKGPTENRMIDILKRVPRDKKLIVAGCLPLINPERLRKEVQYDGVTGPATGDRIVEVVERVLKDGQEVVLKRAMNAMPSLNLPRLQSNPLVSIVPVNYGCLGSCAYCCVVFARGHLRSYAIQEIIKRVKADLAKGMREFWITSQDTACYGRDLSTNLARLLQAICDVDEDFMVRVGMMTPNMAMEILDELIQIFQNERIFKFLHLPVQSGDNQTLRRMRRFYSAEEFKEIVETFRAGIPELTLATDVICGFPGERNEAFRKTLQLIGEVKPDIVNVSKFFARPGTLATGMRKEFVPFQEIRRRSSLMTKSAKEVALERNQRWIGWTGKAIVDEVGKIPSSYVARNLAYKPIAIVSEKDLFGKTVSVKVVKAFSTHLEGKIV